MVSCTACDGCGCVELGRELCALWKLLLDKHQISCILLVSLSSHYVHDARSQEPKTSLYICISVEHFEMENIKKKCICFLMGNSPASEFYMPTFRNALSVPSS